MVVLSVNGAVGMACSCISTVFTARGRFGFLWYYLWIGIVKSVLLYAVTGYTFFAGWVPDVWMNALTAFNPNRLSIVIWFMSVANVLTFALLCAEAFGRKRQSGREGLAK